MDKAKKNEKVEPLELLHAWVDENNIIHFENKGGDDTVMALVDSLHQSLAKGDQSGLNLLFSLIVHLCARVSDDFTEQFCRNLKKTVPQYRDAYRNAVKEMKKQAS